jgi:hypothetical protein
MRKKYTITIEVFAKEVIPYLQRNPWSTRQQIQDFLALDSAKANDFLLALFKRGEIDRKKDPSFNGGIRYIYAVPTQSVDVEVVPDGLTDTYIWERVLKRLPTVAASCLEGSRVLKRRNNPLHYTYKTSVATAVAEVCGGNPQDYSISYVFPAINFETQEIERDEPGFQGIPDEIKSEFTIDSAGKATISIRGAARLLGIHKSNLDGGNFPQKLTQTLANKGFQMAGFASEGIPDTAFALIAEYYALDAGKWTNSQAKAIYRAFAAIGVRTWIQSEMGWQPKGEIVTRQDTALTENLQTLLLSVQGLVTANQSQQAMIHDQQSALKDLFEGLNQVGMVMQGIGQKVADHDSKIVEISDYIKERESERQLLLTSVLGVKPSVEAPPKDARMQLIHLVNHHVYANGLGKTGYGDTWAQLHRDIELRCHKSLEAERKRLIATGFKNASKLDAIESLGLLETAVAIAVELFKAG